MVSVVGPCLGTRGRQRSFGPYRDYKQRGESGGNKERDSGKTKKPRTGDLWKKRTFMIVTAEDRLSEKVPKGRKTETREKIEINSGKTSGDPQRCGHQEMANKEMTGGEASGVMTGQSVLIRLDI